MVARANGDEVTRLGPPSAEVLADVQDIERHVIATVTGRDAVSLCESCHLELVHGNALRVTGDAERLTWAARGWQVVGRGAHSRAVHGDGLTVVVDGCGEHFAFSTSTPKTTVEKTASFPRALGQRCALPTPHTAPAPAG